MEVGRAPWREGVAISVVAGSLEKTQGRTLSSGQWITGAVVSAKGRCWTRGVMVGVPPQLSVAVALPVLVGLVESPQARTLSSGQWSRGAVVAGKVSCCMWVLLLVQASVAFQVRSMPAWPVQLAGVAASV